MMTLARLRFACYNMKDYKKTIARPARPLIPHKIKCLLNQILTGHVLEGFIHGKVKN